MSAYCDELSFDVCEDRFDMEPECDDFILQEEPGDGFEMWQGLVGPHYTPSVSPDGELSWSNNGQLPNPAPVNIKGPPGKGLTIKGIAATTAELPEDAAQGDVWLVGSGSPYEGYMCNDDAWVSLGELSVGPAGPPGPQGDDGTTFTPAVSAEGVISWTNDGGKTNPQPVNIKGPQGPQGPAGEAAPLPIHLTATISALPLTISDARILADTSTEESRVTDVVLGNPAALESNLSWTTAAGSVTFSGTLTSGASTTIVFNVSRVEK